MGGAADGSSGDGFDPPLRIDWLEAAEFGDARPGRLGLTFMPGKRGASLRYPGRVYRRDLVRDLETLSASGVRLLVLLVEDHELARWGDPTIIDRGRDAGISIIRRPIPDGEAPPSVDAMDALVGEIDAARELADTAVACMGGVGRTGTVAACALVAGGILRGGRDRARAGRAPSDRGRDPRTGGVRSRLRTSHCRAWSVFG